MTPHTSPLTPEQRDQADRIHQTLLAAAATDLQQLAELLATKTDATIFGETEFTVRDIVHRIGAKAIETALHERKKGGTKGRPPLAPTASMPPNSNAGNPKPL